MCVSTSADARRWKWWHYYSSYERSVRSGHDDRRRARASEEPGPAARAGRGGAALGAIAERLISGCRAATAAIRPALARFYESLDQGQKVWFAGMS